MSNIFGKLRGKKHTTPINRSGAHSRMILQFLHFSVERTQTIIKMNFTGSCPKKATLKQPFHCHPQFAFHPSKRSQTLHIMSRHHDVVKHCSTNTDCNVDAFKRDHLVITSPTLSNCQRPQQGDNSLHGAPRTWHPSTCLPGSVLPPPQGGLVWEGSQIRKPRVAPRRAVWRGQSKRRPVQGESPKSRFCFCLVLGCLPLLLVVFWVFSSFVWPSLGDS